MKLSQILLIVFISLAAALTAVFFIGGGSSGQNQLKAAKFETRLDQIKRDGVLRCGYYNSPPYNSKDPNTGKMLGAVPEIVEEMGRQLKIKIEWTGEVATGSMLSDLNMNRYDMLCSIFAEMPGRAREANFVGPLMFFPAHLFVRKDDPRFDNNYERANQSDITLAIMDGEGSSIFASENFPNAKTYAIPQLSSVTDLYVAVATKKADVVVEEPFSFFDYDKANPGLLREAKGGSLRSFAIGMPIPANEPELKDALNTTLAYLRDSGFVDRVLDKYETGTKSLRVAKPYKE